MLYDLSEWSRFFCAFITGVMLSQSGSLTQVSTNNALAGPSTLGFTGIAVLAVMISRGETYLSLIVFTILLIIFVFTLKVFNMLNNKNFKDNILLVGLCFNLLIGAIFTLVQFLFVGLGIEFPIMIWFGSFKEISDQQFLIYSLLGFSFYLSVARIAKSTSILVLGKEITEGFNINFDAYQKRALFLSLIGTGIVVSFFGVYSFLGLIFPHLLRRMAYFKKDATHELILGSLLMGLGLMGLDMICYSFPIKGVELPVGMISSVLGSVLLMILLLRKAFKR